MARINGKCIGDCSKCELLSSGEVDMVPCILDQIFARTRKQDAEIAEIKRLINEQNKPSKILLAGLDDVSSIDKINDNDIEEKI